MLLCILFAYFQIVSTSIANHGWVLRYFVASVLTTVLYPR